MAKGQHEYPFTVGRMLLGSPENEAPSAMGDLDDPNVVADFCETCGEAGCEGECEDRPAYAVGPADRLCTNPNGHEFSDHDGLCIHCSADGDA